MKIAQVVSTFPPYRGGMGHVAASFADVLRAHGHTCDVFTPDYGGDVVGEPTASQSSVIRLKPVFRSGNAAWLPSLGKRLGDYDVVHLHYPFFGGAESVAWAMRHRKPGQRFIITYHMDTIGSGWKAAFFSLYRLLAMPSILRACDVITVSSLDYARSSALQPFLGALRVIELPFGVSEDFQPAARASSPDVFNLIFVGGLDQAHYFKGLPHLLRAVSLARSAGVPMKLTVVGDGDRRLAFETEVRELELESIVTFAGKVSQQELIRAYQQAAATVLPSVDRSEAFGLVLLESMACGTPVIASDLPGVRTVFEDRISGWKVIPADERSLAATITDVWQAKEQWPRMRQAASERVNAKYRWPAIGKQLLDLYTA